MLHEIGHLLFNHHAVGAKDTHMFGDLLPDLDASLVTGLLGRTDYTTRQEREAEMLASLIRTSADDAAQNRPRSVAGKLAASLGIEASADE
ncbi:hypothetical protein [Streptomyces atriruber]|uniref:hypothetical protein n=1 Tax=Streptomyces atriruber TaxID=545121 RepID=UPI0012FEF1CE|nr:hypothetical protein [Streptomyces atriruber]